MRKMSLAEKLFRIVASTILFTLALGGCGGCRSRTVVPIQQPMVTTAVDPQYEVIQNPNGTQYVVVNDGSTQFLMDMIMFNSLMGNGGYGSVVNYYHVHRSSYPIYSRSSYSTWRSVGRQSYSGYRANSGYRPSSGYKPTNSASSGYKPSGSYRPSTSGSSGYKPSSTPSSSGYRPSSSRPSSSSGYRRH